eukprot:6491541-Amphidinium_carterae.1
MLDHSYALLSGTFQKQRVHCVIRSRSDVRCKPCRCGAHCWLWTAETRSERKSISPRGSSDSSTPESQHKYLEEVAHADNDITVTPEPQLAVPTEDSGDEEQNAQEEKLADKVAQMMTRDRHRQLQSAEQMAIDMQCSRKTARRAVALVAMKTLEAQRGCLEKFLDYVEAMKLSKRVEASLFCTWWRYDETPLKLRPMQATDMLTTEAQALKVFVVEAEWRALLRCSTTDKHAQDNLLVCGSFSPRIVPAQNGTAETIIEVLNKASSVPERAHKLFDNAWRCVETDACPANLRAEKGKALEERAVPTLHLHCCAHKAHTVAAKTWDLPPYDEMKTGILQTMKVLKSPGSFISFSKAAVRVALDRLQLVRNPGVEADAWRHATLGAFAPSPSTSARGAAIVHVLTQKLFNGDWRDG